MNIKITTKPAKDLAAGDHDLGYGKVLVAVTLMNGDILVAYDSNASMTYRPEQVISIAQEVA